VLRGRNVCLGIAAALLVSQLAGARDADDMVVKARVALAVARFAELPGENRNSSPLRLCLVWKDKVPATFLDLAQQKVGARQMEVISGAPYTDCDVIYVHESAPDWRRLLAESRRPALTLGDAPGFLAGGGMIELIIENDAVRFDVNLAALRSQGIRLSAQVLKLARRVQE
jgi:hypothetical protein